MDTMFKNILNLNNDILTEKCVLNFKIKKYDNSFQSFHCSLRQFLSITGLPNKFRAAGRDKEKEKL